MKGTRKLGGAGVVYLFFFHVLSQFSGPDYLGAWNRLLAATSSPGAGGGGYSTNIWVCVSH